MFLQPSSIGRSLEKQETDKSLFVVNDLKPHALAKMLIILKALRRLGDFEFEDIGKDVEATKTAAVLVFVWDVFDARLHSC